MDEKMLIAKAIGRIGPNQWCWLDTGEIEPVIVDYRLYQKMGWMPVNFPSGRQVVIPFNWRQEVPEKFRDSVSTLIRNHGNRSVVKKQGIEILCWTVGIEAFDLTIPPAGFYWPPDETQRLIQRAKEVLNV